MSDLSRYEKELPAQFEHLEVPDKNLAWEEMKQLLDGADDDGGVLIPPSSGNNGRSPWGIGFLLLLVAGSFWFLFKKKDSQENAQKNVQNVQSTISSSSDRPKNIPALSHNNTNIQSAEKPSQSFITKGNQDISSNITITQKDNSKNSCNHSLQQQHSFHKINVATLDNSATELSSSKNPLSSTGNNNDVTTLQHQKNVLIKTSRTINTTIIDAQTGEDDNNTIDSVDVSTQAINKRISSEKIPLLIAAISKGTINNRPLITINHPAVAAKIKKHQNNYWAAGISMQQAIPLDCNCLIPANKDSKTYSSPDYIPSLYARLYHGQKWFMQSELKYDAPIYVDAFTYNTKIQEQRPLNYISTSDILTKIYYSQALVSFNYFVMHGWSLGTGVAYNRFSSAYIQRNVQKELFGTTRDSLLSSSIITNKQAPSSINIMKNNFQWLLETEYNLDRFSFGIRYSIWLKPDMTYIDPFYDRPAQQRLQNSLNVFLRYEFWNSKKEK